MMRKYFAFLLVVLIPVVMIAQTADPGRNARWDRQLDYIKNGTMTLAYKTLAAPSFTGTLTLANSETIDNATNGTIKLTAGVFKHAFDAAAYWTATVADAGAVTFDDVSDGTASFTFSDNVVVVGPLNHAIAGGTSVASAGLLGGAGTSTSSYQTLGAAGGKAFSFYLGSTSTTASDVVTGYYMNVNYGTSGSSAAPSGDVVRGRSYLIGDASGSTAITGGAFTVELAATTASNTGLTAGLRGNLVLPDGVMTNAGTYYGTMAEIYLSGASVNTDAYTKIAPLSVNLSGTAPTSAAQLVKVTAIDFNFPTNMVGDGLIMDDAASNNTVGAKLKIMVNGTEYWVMLADSHN